MHAEQAIFTSLNRRGRAGYQLVAQSPGLTRGEAAAVETWSPSHGALQADAANHAGVTFRQAPSGRYVLSRTVLGRQEYSGRGGRQVYTHALVFAPEAFQRSDYQPFAIYRATLALGHGVYVPDPPATLPAVELPSVFMRRRPDRWNDLVREAGRSIVLGLVPKLEAGLPLLVPYDGDRARLAEAILAHLAPEHLIGLTFSTSLEPSSVRPFRLQLVAEAPPAPTNLAPPRTRPRRPT